VIVRSWYLILNPKPYNLNPKLYLIPDTNRRFLLTGIQLFSVHRASFSTESGTGGGVFRILMDHSTTENGRMT